MVRIRSIPGCILILALLNLPMQAASEPPWLQIRSTHYTVITDAGEKRGREVALRFEQMRVVFAGLLTKDRLNESRPLTILAFKDDKSYYQLAPLHEGQPLSAPGFFSPGEDQDFIALNLLEPEPWRAVARDFALRLLKYNYPPAQGWFDEGLAEYFSSMRINNGQVEIGGDPGLDSITSRNLPGTEHGANAPKSLTDLLGSQAWLSLPDLFAMKVDSTRNEGTHPALYYAQSWMVMHYLLHEKKLSETGAYFGLVLNRHLPVEDAIQQAFGVSSAQLEQAVKDYFHTQSGRLLAVDSAAGKSPDPSHPNGNLPSQTEHFPVPVGQDDSTITVNPIPETDVRVLYAGVQIRIPERREAGLKTLTQLATTPTDADRKAEAKPVKRMGEDAEQLPTNAIGHPLAHRFLAWDHIQNGKFEEAFSEMGDAASLNPRDMWVRYYLCIAKYRLAQARHNEMIGLANMMLDLRAVLEWNPQMAEAYDLLAVARSAGGSSTAALESERAAIGLSPRDQSYLLHLAQIYVAGKKYEAAGSLLERLKTSDNSQIATAASDLLSQMAAQRRYGIAAGSATAPAVKYDQQKSPFDALEEEAAKRDAAGKGDQPGAADRRTTKFVKGRLVAVDCSNPPSAVLTVSSGSGILKLRASDYKSLLLIGADDFSCQWRDLQVTANYKPRGSADGDLVSLEMR